MKYFLMIFILFYSSYSLADIYMSTDAHGNITYSDEPSGEATKIQVLESENLVDVPVSTEVKTTTTQTTVKGENVPYTTFLIASPLDEETIQNQPNITLTLTIVPQLQKGDTVQAFVDELPVGAPTESSTISLGRLDRGRHRVRAALLDKDHKVVKLSQTITIYAQYARLGTQSLTDAANQKKEELLKNKGLFAKIISLSAK